MIPRRSFIAALAAVAALAPAAAQADDVIVFAAASLKNALDDISTRYLNGTGKTVTISYAGSSTLARQIEQGAPVDIFFSADEGWMDYLAERGLIRPDTRTTLLGNAIVLVAPAASDASIAVAPGMNLASALGRDSRLAVANVEAVPAGRYAKAALESVGAWPAVADRIVQADNVRAALAFVARGEVPLGIVYATDAAAEPAVKIVGRFPDDSHPPILYPLAMTAGSHDPDARTFFDFVQSEAARSAYAQQGFAFIAPGS